MVVEVVVIVAARHLVLRLHLIELVDAADPAVGEHQRARLDAELAGLLVLRHRRRQPRRTRRLPTRVHGARQDRANVLEELRLGGRGVADEAQVDVAAQFDPVLLALLVHAAEQPGVW